jgi:murein DD-endopeptidase MepM/ murein hydrolase activator NlpD
MSRTKSDESLTALAIAGTLLTVGGFVIAAAFSGRLSVPATKQNTDGPSDAPQRTEPGATPLPPRLRGYGEDDLEAAARMLASEKGDGSRELWTEMIWSQIHARKPGETLYERITAGSGYGPQGKAKWPGKKRPVATDQSALPVHLSFAEEVLGGLHPARFAGATAFFEPEEQDKALRVATRARQKAKQGLPLTAQESRLRHYQQSAEEIRADWQKTMRMVGTIAGMEFYEEMSRLNPGKSDFAIREKAKMLSWPITPTELQRVGDGVTDSRPSTGQPHKGVDLFAEPGTEVHAARSGQVKRVVDGRGSKREHTRRAGLWVDVEVGDQIDRYMHLGEARVTEGQKVRRGDVLGVIAEAHTSGTGDGPHLHFEVRAADYNKERGDYGAPVTPKFEVV